MDKNIIEFEDNNNKKKYKIKRIWENTVYAKELAVGYLSNLYYLVFSKDYPKKKNT